jgi:hypothetical protein
MEFAYIVSVSGWRISFLYQDGWGPVQRLVAEIPFLIFISCPLTLFKDMFSLVRELDSSVCIATAYGLEDRGWIPDTGKRYPKLLPIKFRD